VREKIFIYGASGHAKVVIDLLERQGRVDIAFLVDDDPALAGRDFFGYKVIGGWRELLDGRFADLRAAIVAIGDNHIRGRLAGRLLAGGYRLDAAIHPAASLGRGVTVGHGTVVMAGAVVNADAVIGANVIVNTGAIVDHDCRIGAGVHLGPGAVLCGNVAVGEATLVGAGATILPNLTIGAGATIGAGSTVIDNLPDGVTVAGTPARSLQSCGPKR